MRCARPSEEQNPVNTSSKLSEALPETLDEANNPRNRFQRERDGAPSPRTLALPRPRKPRFPARLADAAERAARLIGREVLVNPDKEGIEDMIGLAMWLESLSTWRKYKNNEAAIKRAEWAEARRDSNCPG